MWRIRRVRRAQALPAAVPFVVPAVVFVLVCGLAAPAAAEQASSRHASTGRLRIVAVESFWGSIVRQLAGRHATVESIITNPDTDPHDYEARPSDPRRLAAADYVIVNGSGYDPWAQKLLDADGTSERRVLDVGKLVGVAAGGNPHQWYSPAVVERFVDRVAPRTCADRPGGRGGVLHRAQGGLREHARWAVPRSDRVHTAGLRRDPGRRVGEHVRPWPPRSG